MQALTGRPVPFTIKTEGAITIHSLFALPVIQTNTAYLVFLEAAASICADNTTS